MGSVLMALLPLLLEAAGPAIRTIPSEMEKRYRDAVKGDMTSLAKGGGGMGQGKLQELQGQAAGQVNAQQAQQQAQLARMGANGASGLQMQAARGAAQQGSNAMRGAMSDIRAQDLAAAQERRNSLDERMRNVLGMDIRSKDIWGQMAASHAAGQNAQELAGASKADTTASMAKDMTKNMVPPPPSGSYGSASGTAGATGAAAPAGG